MNPFVVPKRRVEIEVLCRDGARQQAAVFLADHVPLHDGPERLVDLLQSGQPFVPALLLPGDRPVWLQREGILWVRVASVFEPSDEAPTLPTEHDVELVLSDGSRLEGLVSYVRPDASARLTDHLNDGHAFLRLLQGTDVVLVHKRHVVRVALSEG